MRLRGSLEPGAVFYRQWSNMYASERVFKERKSITEMDPLVKGQVELPIFREQVLYKNMAIRNQFEDVTFEGSAYLENRLVRLFTQGDQQISLFNATNMKTLFEIGNKIENDNVTGEFHIFKLKPLVEEMGGRVSEGELFVVYSYLKNLIDGTFLQVDTPNNSTFDKTSMAFTLTHVVRNEFERFRANFTSKIISAVALKFLRLDS